MSARRAAALTCLVASPALARPIETACGGDVGVAVAYTTAHDVWRPPKTPDAAPVERHSAGSLTFTVTAIDGGQLHADVQLGDGEMDAEPDLMAVIEELVESGFDLTPPVARVSFDAHQRVPQVDNADAWIAYNDRVLDAMLPGMRARMPTLTPEGEAQMKAALAQPAVATQDVSRYAYPIVGYWCAAFDKPTVRYANTRPNPLGGDALQVDGVMRLRKAGTELRIHVDEHTTVDVSGWLAAFAPKDTPPDKIAAVTAMLKGLETRSTTDVVLDARTGLVIRYTSVAETPILEGSPPVRDEVRIERAP